MFCYLIDFLDDKQSAAPKVPISAIMLSLMFHTSKEMSLNSYTDDCDSPCVGRALQNAIELFEIRIVGQWK